VAALVAAMPVIPAEFCMAAAIKALDIFRVNPQLFRLAGIISMVIVHN